MVVPTVLAINARRNCAWCSASGNGPAVMSNVVIMNLLDYESPGAHQAGTCWKAFHLHPQKWMVASTAIFLFGWAAASLRASDRAGCRRAVNQWRAAPAVRHRGSGKMARSCSLKIQPHGPPGKFDL